MEDMFLEIMDSVNIEYEIVRSRGDDMRVFIPFNQFSGGIVEFVRGAAKDIEEALLSEGVDIDDIIMDEFTDGVEVAIEIREK
jgi:hypothetical protein